MWHDKLENCCSLSKEYASKYKTERNAIKYCKKADWLWYYFMDRADFKIHIATIVLGRSLTEDEESYLRSGTPVINSLKMIRLCSVTCPLSYKYIEHIRKYILERIKK